MTQRYRSLVCSAALIACLISVCGYAVTFERITGFPEAAPGAYGIKAEALPDGRWVAWNGDAVFAQKMAGGDSFVQIASGYAGDPGFIAVAPDGHTLLLGAGQSGKLYVFDTAAPHDYMPGSEAATVPHYYGVYLSQNLVLLDKATGDYTTSELVVVDLSAPSPVAKTVMLKPAQADLVGTEYGVSACLAIDAARANVYAMNLVYDGWDLMHSQLKRISAPALIAAFNSKAALDWNTDAVAIGGDGAFFSGGPAGISLDSDLLIGGFGGVQRVDPASGTVVETYSPAGPFEYYGVAFNSYTNTVLPMVANPDTWAVDVIYGPVGDFAPLPVFGLTGAAALMGTLLVAARRRLKRSGRM